MAETLAPTTASVRPLRPPFGTGVAGVSFRQAELRDVVEGDELTVIAADDNPHDANACEVRTADRALLGFIPKALAGRLRAAGSGPWPARVDEVLRYETWGLRITVLPEGDEVPGGRQQRAAEVRDRAASTPADPGAQNSAPLPASGAPDAAATRRRTVKATSGRVLGELVRIDGSKVVVAAGDREIGYPASVVVIEDAG